MNRAVVVCSLCAVLISCWLDNVGGQLRNEHDSFSIIQSLETLTKVVEGLQAEIKMQSSVLNNFVSKEELQSFLLNNLATKLDLQIQKIAFQNLEAKAAMHDNSLSTLQATVDELKTLLIKSSENEDEQVTSLSNLEAQSNMQMILLNKVGENLENQTSLLNNLLTKQDMQVNNLTNTEAKATTVCDSMEILAKVNESLTSSKGDVEGILAGTDEGVVIIPLDSRELRTISSNGTNGVAFNWQSRKVYWIEPKVGIKISDLDGSSVELLISDPDLGGLAVDQITGNLYYGVKGYNARIRVCDSMGQKCTTIVSGYIYTARGIRDIALYPSEGLMFWSSSRESVVRASMDGANATTIILDPITGVYLDELTERLYWSNYGTLSIGHHDLYGNHRNVLLNTTIFPYDIAVDGDTVYFSGNNPKGVYSVSTNRQVSSFANVTGDIYHIALYGRDKLFSRPNPCKDSPCANLCVLNRVSYTCL